ncbi:MAG: hypothetical protein OEV78_13095 [Spirochaetia bacterium]|nr:hypothetical protein [Spirochaetia bacterium]
MEIGGNNKNYPGNVLSNFTANRFVFQGVECQSMEGFLQSLKFEKEHIQIEVCKFIGFAAKKRGKFKNWKQNQTLYWKGIAYKRDSKEYQFLLDDAFDCLMCSSEKFRNALKASGNAKLKHSIGKSKIQDTVLTEQEFCSRLEKLRNRLDGFNVNNFN